MTVLALLTLSWIVEIASLCCKMPSRRTVFVGVEVCRKMLRVSTLTIERCSLMLGSPCRGLTAENPEQQLRTGAENQELRAKN